MSRHNEIDSSLSSSSSELDSGPSTIDRADANNTGSEVEAIGRGRGRGRSIAGGIRGRGTGSRRVPAARGRGRGRRAGNADVAPATTDGLATSRVTTHVAPTKRRRVVRDSDDEEDSEDEEDTDDDEEDTDEGSTDISEEEEDTEEHDDDSDKDTESSNDMEESHLEVEEEEDDTVAALRASLRPEEAALCEAKLRGARPTRVRRPPERYIDRPDVRARFREIYEKDESAEELKAFRRALLADVQTRQVPMSESSLDLSSELYDNGSTTGITTMSSVDESTFLGADNAANGFGSDGNEDEEGEDEEGEDEEEEEEDDGSYEQSFVDNDSGLTSGNETYTEDDEEDYR